MDRMGRTHNLVSISDMKVTLGGGYALNVFTIALKVGSQPEGAPGVVHRAYVTDENRPDKLMVSLDLTEVAATIDAMRAHAAHAIARGVLNTEVAR